MPDGRPEPGDLGSNTIRWHQATVVVIRRETERATTFRLRLPEPIAHRAGQHYIVRLTAPDGYTASRSYSVATPPDNGLEFELTVERLEGGEVSSFLHDEVVVGDELEVRGPMGGFFVWDADRPALLIGGGSGVVPLMAMLRLARARGVGDLVRLIVSARGDDELLYREEVVGPETTLVFSRRPSALTDRPVGRLAPADLDPLLEALDGEFTAYICGSAGFADSATSLLLERAVPVGNIRVERFGPT